MGERATEGSLGRDGPRLVALVVASILAMATLGFGVVSIVDALEPEGCGPYGYGGYGCEPIGDATIAVEPSAGLVDRQTVTVTGEGFGPSTSFGAAQCDPSVGPDAGTDACDLSTARLTSTDAAGQVELTMPVRRIITVQGREVDCALEPCTIGGATLSGTTPIEAASAPISFDPSVPPVPRLTIEVTVDDVTGSAITGTVTCNREAEAYIDAYLSQQKGGHAAFAYGYSEQSIACDTAPTEWTATLTTGSGRFTGGQADYEVYAYAYDGFEDASSLATGQVRVSAGPFRALPPGEQPGETVRVQIAGTTRGPDGLLVDLVVTCDRPVPEGFVYVAVSQWAGLDQVTGYGGADLGPCDGVVETSVPVTGLTGTLVGGPATAEAAVEIYDFTPPDEFFDFASARASVRLRGAQRAVPLEVVPNPGSRITITGASRTTLTGVLTCEGPAEVELGALVQQKRGRTLNEVYAFDQLACDGSTPFSLQLEGQLSGGSASAFMYATAYRVTEEEYEFLWDDQQAASLRIRG